MKLSLFAIRLVPRGKSDYLRVRVCPGIFCRICGRLFEKWGGGTASHGWMHVRRGDARARATTERWEFTISPDFEG